MAEKYIRRARRLQRVERVGTWITAIVGVVFIPVELYNGRPLHAIYFLLFMWGACRDLASPQRRIDTLPAEGTPTS
jgi:hypothetical protein